MLIQQPITMSTNFEPVRDRGSDDSTTEMLAVIQVIGDYDNQLAAIGQQIQDNLTVRKNLQKQLADIATILSQSAVFDGKTAYRQVSATDMKKLSLYEGNFTAKEVAGDIWVSQKDLQQTSETLQEQASATGTSSEIVSLQIQSLVEQRQNAVTLVSNLVAARHEQLMATVKNLSH